MARNAFEDFFAHRLKDPEVREHYDRARAQIQAIDAVMRVLDHAREDRGWSKAELARRAGLSDVVVRRLFSQEDPNPTLKTITALAEALDVGIGLTAKQAFRETEAPDPDMVMVGGRRTARRR